MTSAESAWPVRRRLVVGVTTPTMAGGGHLLVGPRELICELGPLNRRLSGFVRVTHTGHQVHVFRARLVPFWFNVSVAVDDGRIAVRASKSAFELGSLVGVLRAAGFEVVVHRTWFDRGQSLGVPRG